LAEDFAMILAALEAIREHAISRSRCLKDGSHQLNTGGGIHLFGGELYRNIRREAAMDVPNPAGAR
jgi:hypothetical protein